MRPPSSGAAGSRLKTASIPLTSASQAKTAANGAVDSPTSHAAPPSSRARAIDTAGPAAAIRSSLRGGRRLLVELGQPAQEPQGDATDAHPLAERHERMTQLVGQHRRQEHHCPGHTQDERCRRTQRQAAGGGEEAAEGERQEAATNSSDQWKRTSIPAMVPIRVPRSMGFDRLFVGSRRSPPPRGRWHRGEPVVTMPPRQGYSPVGLGSFVRSCNARRPDFVPAGPPTSCTYSHPCRR